MTGCICGKNAYDRTTGICFACGHGSAVENTGELALEAALVSPDEPVTLYKRAPRRVGVWDSDRIILAIRVWHARHGRIPRSTEWSSATSLHPSADMTRRVFDDGWKGAIRAAGFTPDARGRKPRVAA